MAIWKKEYDPYVSIIEPSTSRVLAIVLEKPGMETSIHITVYLPTAGKDADFARELSILQEAIDHIIEKYSDSQIFIRGDANASIACRNNNKRDSLFKHFLDENNLNYVDINHNTYHHFTNDGMSDSCIDVILLGNTTTDGLPCRATESLDKVLCSKTHSSHDVPVSTILL